MLKRLYVCLLALHPAGSSAPLLAAATGEVDVELWAYADNASFGMR